MGYKIRMAILGLLSIALVISILLFAPGIYPLICISLAYLQGVNGAIMWLSSMSNMGRSPTTLLISDEPLFFYKPRFLASAILLLLITSAVITLSFFFPPVTLFVGLMVVAALLLGIAMVVNHSLSHGALKRIKEDWKARNEFHRKRTSCFIDELGNLHTQYQNLSSFDQRFYPTTLRQELEKFSREKTKEQAFKVYRAFHNTWFFQRWFFHDLNTFHTDAGEAYRILDINQLLRGEIGRSNFNAMLEHQRLKNVVDILSILNENELLKGAAGQSNFNRVASHQYSGHIASALYRLSKSGLLKHAVGQKNFDAVVSCTGPYQMISPAIRSIATIRQIDFERLMANAEILLRSDVWERIPQRHLTSTQFERIIAIAQTHAEDPAAGRAALLEHVNTVILRIGVAGTPAYNPAQSTHTASVHRSASESAARLKSNYGSKKINSESQLTTVLDSLSTWLEKQANPNWFTKWFRRPPNLHKIEAAKRGLDRIRHPSFVYTDVRSGVSIQELLGLLWVAITDDSKRAGTLQDAQQWMIEALYESQRGGNLSDRNVDMGGNDLPICTSGTFNKLIEKFSNIHSDVNLVIITREGASAKFQALVKEEALTYLHQLKTDGKRDELSRLLDKITASDNENAVGPLWAFISERVADRLFEEFKSLYSDDKNNQDFQTLISTGEYTTLDAERLDALRGAIVAPIPTPSGTGLSSTPVTASQAGLFAPTRTTAPLAQDQAHGLAPRGLS